jgi:hypothetical protein
MSDVTPRRDPRRVDPRDAAAVAAAAPLRWVEWMPGDGSAYLVHVERITTGPDHTDRVLLLNIQRRTIALQFPNAAYRLDEQGRWTRARCVEQGLPVWAWDAARPLLEQYGVTATRPTPTTPEED